VAESVARIKRSPRPRAPGAPTIMPGMKWAESGMPSRITVNGNDEIGLEAI